MRFREYLRDRRYPVLFWTAAMGVSEGVMLLFGSTGALQVFLLAIWAGRARESWGMITEESGNFIRN